MENLIEETKRDVKTEKINLIEEIKKVLDYASNYENFFEETTITVYKDPDTGIDYNTLEEVIKAGIKDVTKLKAEKRETSPKIKIKKMLGVNKLVANDAELLNSFASLISLINDDAEFKKFQTQINNKINNTDDASEKKKLEDERTELYAKFGKTPRPKKKKSK